MICSYANCYIYIGRILPTVQGYCNLMAELSLVIKMGRNVNKCTLYLYNIPEHEEVPVFTSIAWSYENQGPVKGTIATIIMRREAITNHLICYEAPPSIWDQAPSHIKNIFKPRKYLGVPTSAQLDNSIGKEKILTKLKQRIGLVASKSDNIRETMISHNMLVCQVATFAPLCISMSLQECISIDKVLLKTYQHRLNFAAHDAKHSIFISKRKGGIGLRSFTREFIGALLRDTEVYISNEGSDPTHALICSLEEATKLELWKLHAEEKIPQNTSIAHRITQYQISAKKTYIYYNSFEETPEVEITYDHRHLMKHMIELTSALGFMLRDLNKELLARFTDELLVMDKKIKSLASSKNKSRAAQGPIIGTGQGNLYKYTLLGHVYLYAKIIWEEATNNIMQQDHITQDTQAIEFERRILSQALYKEIPLFSKEISAQRLTQAARNAISKLKHDYKVCGFYQLIEWRATRHDIANGDIIQPNPNDYIKIIDDHNCFQPNILSSSHQNSMHLVDHLLSILKLQQENQGDPAPRNNPGRQCLSDHEIIELALKHDLPIFVSLDGSRDEQGIATISMSIVAPDIREEDEPDSSHWQHRIAKILLIRSWRLPKSWGTSDVCINMAESIGFILGEYTIPSDLPIIYITDSNNARTLQKRIKNKDDCTHRNMVRHVKQGIDCSITNHLEYLTSKWPADEQLSGYAKRLYHRGENTCYLWAHTPGRPRSTINIDEEDLSYNSEENGDILSIDDIDDESNKKYHFDLSMFDILQRNIILKVFSHQLNADFQPKVQNKIPSPNLCIVSANQHTDNAAAQAKRIINVTQPDYDLISYPPFSSRGYLRLMD
jgi:hypothetical protein